MSLETKCPKKFRRGPIREYRCQFCGLASGVQEWQAQSDHCPKCGKLYDAIAIRGVCDEEGSGEIPKGR